MAHVIENTNSIRIAAVLLAGFPATLMLGGCQSPMYSGTPDDMSYQDRSYIGRNEEVDGQPGEESWTADQKYEYRGGRDPVTGRANTQM